MKPINHVIISGGVTAAFAYWVQSLPGVIACFLSGIFIDLDHHLDYLIVRKKIPFSYNKLVDYLKNDHKAPIYLFFHSYELLALLWLGIFYLNLDVVWLGIAVGCTTHILCDEFANPLRPLAYFLTYRIWHKFNRKMFFKKGHPDAGP